MCLPRCHLAPGGIRWSAYWDWGDGHLQFWAGRSLAHSSLDPFPPVPVPCTLVGIFFSFSPTHHFVSMPLALFYFPTASDL